MFTKLGHQLSQTASGPRCPRAAGSSRASSTDPGSTSAFHGAIGHAPSVQSGFKRLAFFLALATVAAWTYVFNKWWGGEWWGVLLAFAAAVPVGLVFSILPSMLLRTLRRLRLLKDALIIWLFIVGGTSLGAYALIAFEGTTLVMVSLAGTELFVAGVEGRLSCGAPSMKAYWLIRPGRKRPPPRPG